MTGGYPPEIVDAALTVRPRWLAGLIARHGQPTTYQSDPVRLGESRFQTWAWVGLGVQVEQTLTTWAVFAHRGGIRAKLAGLKDYPTDAQISAVVALAGLDARPGAYVVTTPDAVTETIQADKLTPGRTVLIPMTESLETVTRVRVSGSYVTVHTNRTGPEFAYQWPANHEIDVVRGVPGRAS